MKKKQHGLSLIEILISVTITAALGVLIVNVLTSSNNLFIKQTVEVNQGLSSNQASLHITNLVKTAAGVAAQYPASGTPQYTSGANVLVLKLPALNQSGQIIDSVFDYAVIVKEPADSKILRAFIFADNLSSREGENRVLSTSLKTISFEYLDLVNNPIAPVQAARVEFTIDLIDDAGVSDTENRSGGIVNIKNYDP